MSTHAQNIDISKSPQTIESEEPPQKKCTIFLIPQAGHPKFLTPSPLDHPPTAGLKITNPLE